MQMPKLVTDFIANRCTDLMRRRPADVLIGPEGDPYMKRWFVIPRNRVFNIYLHHFRHDDERTLHSHPWWSVSLMLQGMLTEFWTPTAEGAADENTHRKRDLWIDDITFRSAGMYHRLVVKGSATTLFITGPKFRSWYFACKQGLIDWRDYVSTRNPGQPGAGCGEADISTTPTTN